MEEIEEMKKVKNGLVLEGGAMRGMFTAGVCDVLMENNIEFDGACGVSAGATFGCNYKSKQIGRVIRYNKRFSKDKRYCSFSSLVKTGNLYNAEFCYETLPFELDIFDTETYGKNPMKFYAVATDIVTGKSVYRELKECNKEDLTFMRASASMPLVSRPVEFEGLKLLDGGISDSIPLEFMEKSGYSKNLVILTQPKDFVKKQNSLYPLMKIFLRKYPALVKAMKERHIVYNKETDYVFSQEKNHKAFVICPRKSLNIKRTEKSPKELDRVYEEGRKAALEKLDALKVFLSKND